MNSPIPVRFIHLISRSLRNPSASARLALVRACLHGCVLSRRTLHRAYSREDMRTFEQNQSVLCVPSQYGGVLVCLHWHKATSFFSFTENSTGSIPVPWWDPEETKGPGIFFVSVLEENLRGLSGFLDAGVEPLPAAIQNAPISFPRHLTVCYTDKNQSSASYADQPK